MNQPQPDFLNLGSQGSKRERTRASLLRSGVAVIAEKGVEALRITDVTEHAGVANGTYYNYFDDKDALITAISDEVLGGLAEALDRGLEGEDNAVRRMTLASAGAIRGALIYAEVGAVVANMAEQVPATRGRLLQFMRQDLTLGVEQGRFEVEVSDFLLEQIFALVVVAIRAQSRSGLDPEKTKQVCEHILRLCGLTPSAARRAVASVL